MGRPTKEESARRKAEAEALLNSGDESTPIKIESDLPDEKVLFLSDIFPTGYMAAENAEIEPGDTVAIWGCGPVAPFAIKSAWMFKAGRVIAIEPSPQVLPYLRKNVALNGLSNVEIVACAILRIV